MFLAALIIWRCLLASKSIFPQRRFYWNLMKRLWLSYGRSQKLGDKVFSLRKEKGNQIESLRIIIIKIFYSRTNKFYDWLNLLKA